MADTLPDITLSVGWNDLYTLSGIVQGTPLILKNKSSSPILIVISTATPNATDEATAITLVNALKTKVNQIITALKA